MKRILLVLSLIIISQTASAQLFSKKKIQNNQNIDKEKWSWGHFLGFNSYDFNFDYKQDLEDIQTNKTLGFSVGLIGNMRINEFLDLRLEQDYLFRDVIWFITKVILMGFHSMILICFARCVLHIFIFLYY